MEASNKLGNMPMLVKESIDELNAVSAACKAKLEELEGEKTKIGVKEKNIKNAMDNCMEKIRDAPKEPSNGEDVENYKVQAAYFNKSARERAETARAKLTT